MNAISCRSQHQSFGHQLIPVTRRCCCRCPHVPGLNNASVKGSCVLPTATLVPITLSHDSWHRLSNQLLSLINSSSSLQPQSDGAAAQFINTTATMRWYIVPIHLLPHYVLSRGLFTFLYICSFSFPLATSIPSLTGAVHFPSRFVYFFPFFLQWYVPSPERVFTFLHICSFSVLFASAVPSPHLNIF